MNAPSQQGWTLARVTGGLLRRAARWWPARRYSMRNPRPLLSICFDDVPASACREGAQILEAAGVRGTFYVCAGLTQPDNSGRDMHTAEDLVRLHRAGHELGSHGFAHLNYESLTPAEALADLQRNDDAMAELIAHYRFATFAFPFGGVRPSTKRAAGARFHCMRGIHGGVNAGMMDVSLLKANEFYQRTMTASRLESLLHETVQRNGWLILFTHDVRARPSDVGCTPELLRLAVQRAAELGLEVLPVKQALARAAFHPI
jgi:peptidoglycan/xylan/chitin deacetylase (PgdA/CDA1 family)